MQADRYSWISDVLQEIAWFLAKNDLPEQSRIIVDAAEKAGFPIEHLPLEPSAAEHSHSELPNQIVQFHRKNRRLTRH